VKSLRTRVAIVLSCCSVHFRRQIGVDWADCIHRQRTNQQLHSSATVTAEYKTEYKN
jgi:hypothetical protein